MNSSVPAQQCPPAGPKWFSDFKPEGSHFLPTELNLTLPSSTKEDSALSTGSAARLNSCRETSLSSCCHQEPVETKLCVAMALLEFLRERASFPGSTGELGSSPDHTGEGALLRTKHLERNQFKLHEKALTTKKLKGCRQ